MDFKLVIFVVLLGLVLSEDVLDLTDSNFDEVKKHNVALVMFYAPWCGHCKRLKPEFERAASILKKDENPVVLVKVDCTEGGKETCSAYDVSGYPTVKVFRNGAASEYNGPREANGIVKFMRSQAGPSIKKLKSVEETEKFLKVNEVSVVYFGEGSLEEAFLKVGEKLREYARFGHATDPAILEKYKHKNTIVLYRPTIMANKFEDSEVLYKGGADVDEIEKFVKQNFHGLVGLMTSDNQEDFAAPRVVAYFKVDYDKNPKGTNYWRNRVIKVAQDFKDFSFAIAAKDEFQRDLTEFGFEEPTGEKPVICSKDANGKKYVMKEEFTVDSLKAFVTKLKAGEIEAYIKSEAVPDNTNNAVKVAVANNFDELVKDSGRDALIEFYAPWCGHCKKLEPIFEELGEKLKGEKVDIVKMDATANEVPKGYDVKGFPTLFWKTKDGQIKPYSGGRDLAEFIKFIAKEASEELNGYDRKGAEKEKTEEAEKKIEL